MTRKMLAVLRRVAKEGPEGGYVFVRHSTLADLLAAGLIDEYEIKDLGRSFARVSTFGVHEVARLRDH